MNVLIHDMSAHSEMKRSTKWKLLLKHKSLSYFLFLVCIGNFSVIFIKYCKHKLQEAYPSAENITAAEHSIFFHETSGNGQLTIRQACCVESCAIVNPESKINVILSSTIDSSFKALELLETYRNVRFFIVDIEKYVKNTPMEKFNLNILSQSEWPMQVTSDALRYLTLYKYGGVYLDLDVMVVRPLRVLGRNWAAKEVEKIGSGALAFGTDKLGRYMAEQCIRDFVKNFDPGKYLNNGPMVIDRVLTKLCISNHSKLKNIKRFKNYFTCNGFTVYRDDTFSPNPFDMSQKYFMPMFAQILNSDFESSNDIYGYHMFNYVTRKLNIERGSFYADLAEKFCPKVYEEFLYEFSH